MNSHVMELSGKKLFLVMALITLSSCLARSADTPGLQTISLDGAWQVASGDGSDGDWLPATVPGCIHTDLLAAEKFPIRFIARTKSRPVGRRDQLDLPAHV